MIQSRGQYNDRTALIGILPFLNAGIAAACFAWLFLVVVSFASAWPERKVRGRTSLQIRDLAGPESLGHDDGCDYPWCEPELCRSLILDDTA
jgi:hypothetical protein